MYISLNWLKRYIDIDSETLNNKLSIYTSEIESEKKLGDLPHIVVGKVAFVEKHPNADKLRVAKVDTGEGTLRQIVCGAANLAEGQKVPVALPGAMMPAGFEIKEAELRGVESRGMICSSDELGLTSERQPGIMVLPEDAPIGTNIAEYLEIADTIFEIENKSITNRPDLFGHYGIAREISVFENLHLKPFLLDRIENNTSLPTLNITIEDREACKRYTAVKIENLTIKESPTWLQNLLRSVGITPRNTIVDVTNFIMYDLGEPMHAFDADKISNDTIEIGYNTAAEEEVYTLKDEPALISQTDLLIKNNGKPVAIAGVMGLKNSAISDETTSIILEAATFHYAHIRKTSRRTGIRTESSLRFEKQLDPEYTLLALHKAISLIMELHPEAMIASQITDVYPEPAPTIKIGTSYSYLQDRCGESLSKERIQHILSKLGCVLDEAGDTLIITVPSWRATGDLSAEEDILEEIIRMYGFNDFQGSLPSFPMGAPSGNTYRNFERHLKDICVYQHNLLQTDAYSFYAQRMHTDFLLQHSIHENPIRVVNPLSQDHELMKTSLVPHIAQHLRENAKFEHHVGVFELGRIYKKVQGKIYDESSKTAYEERMLGIGLYTKNVPTDTEMNLWNEHPFFHMKHILEDIFQRLHVSELIRITSPEEEQRKRFPTYHPGKSACIFLGDTLIGMFGEIHPEICMKQDMEHGVFVCAEIQTEPLFACAKKPYFAEFSHTPALTRDVSFVVKKHVPTGDVLSFLHNFHKYVQHVELHDVYEGEHIPEGTKSISCVVSYAHPHKTLTDAEINSLAEKLFQQAKDEFGAIIRGT